MPPDPLCLIVGGQPVERSIAVLRAPDYHRLLSSPYR
jgi:hypothetical protein